MDHSGSLGMPAGKSTSAHGYVDAPVSPVSRPVWCPSSILITYPRSGSRRQYPLRVGIIGDVGQTVNSTTTRNHLAANKPQVSTEPHVLTQQGM